jgi:TPR repeat protein
MYGFPQDYAKALEHWHRAGELGHAASYHNIGYAYLYGRGVERNEKKAKHYWELAAMGGDETARHNLGILEEREDNHDRALKHYMISVEFGDTDSLKQVKQLCVRGRATKDDYAKALKAYQAYISEIKSDDRDKAAAYSDNYKYYE